MTVDTSNDGVAVTTTTIFSQECLQYTLMARVAPLWNRVGRLYIEGRDFLMQSTVSSKLRATQLRLSVAQDQITWNLKPILVKMPRVKLRGMLPCRVEAQSNAVETQRRARSDHLEFEVFSQVAEG